jgi:hypothetical protein
MPPIDNITAIAAGTMPGSDRLLAVAPAAEVDCDCVGILGIWRFRCVITLGACTTTSRGSTSSGQSVLNRHNVGCRIEDTLHIRKIDEDSF